MLSILPETPGRSRFSKVLPTPPPDDEAPLKSPNLTRMLLESPLPPLPQEEMAASLESHRRPVTGKPSTTSLLSSGSDYSESPGLSRSETSSDHEKDSLSGIESETASSPIPSVAEIKLIEDPLPSPSNSASNQDTSPPRPELWRRRSEKSDRSIVVAELKLEKSNGSTASPPRRKELPAASEYVTFSQSLAGRKPIAVRPAPAQPEKDLMGNKLSKKRAKDLQDSSSGSNKHNAAVQHDPFVQQGPSPESLKTETSQLSEPQIVSSVCPLPSPDGEPPAIPRRAESRATSSAAASKSSEASISSESTTRPTPISLHSRQLSDARTIKSEPAVVHMPHPQKSITPSELVTRQQTPQRETPSFATDFPMLPSPVYDETIFLGLPLDVTHFECFHFHKYMRAASNTSCSVACMICQKRDTETRWRCTWCCLSACGSCMKTLSSIPGKNLKECLVLVGK